MGITATLEQRNGTRLRSASYFPIDAGRGAFLWVDKSTLQIDHEYQRKCVNQHRVREIARCWIWAACGVILVSRRPDGSLWVYDGQHRVLAALLREDISSLPCLVFDMDALSDEAAAFVAANTVRGPMRATEKFRGLLVAEDEIALEVQRIAKSCGYAIGGDGPRSLRCVGTLLRLAKTNTPVLKDVLALLAELYGTDAVHEDVMQGVFWLEVSLRKGGQTLCRGHNKAALMQRTPARLKDAIRRAKEHFGRSGEKVCAEAIVQELNRGRSTRRLASLMG